MPDEKEQLDNAPDFSNFFEKSDASPNSTVPIYEDAPVQSSSRLKRIIVFVSGGSLENDTQVSFAMIGLIMLCVAVIGFLLWDNNHNADSSAKPGLETFKNAPKDKVPLELRNVRP